MKIRIKSDGMITEVHLRELAEAHGYELVYRHRGGVIPIGQSCGNGIDELRL